MPAALVGDIFQEVCDRLKALPSMEIPDRWRHLKGVFSSVLVADGATLEGLRKKTKELRNEQGVVLGGKIAVMVEAFGLRPMWQSHIEEWTANDKRFSEEILGAVPAAGLVVFDLGFFSFPWFDEFTDQGKYFVTRMREKTAYKVVQPLSEGRLYRDRIIEVGQYRSHPCRHRLRLVEVLWGKRWYRYLTNVLDPQMLSARDVCDLYRTRWRIEDAFGLTKRLLDLAYLWSGSKNAVKLQVYATLIFYGVLIEICQQVAEVVRKPLERISVEMVFRGFYHYSRAFRKGESQDLVSFMAHHSDLLGIVKRKRKSHKEAEQRAALIWGDA
jgi:hypothetical protein